MNLHSEVISFSDITDRIEELEVELEEELAAASNNEADAGDPDDQDERIAELKVLTELAGELEDEGGDHKWRGGWYPGSLIADWYFQKYAEQLADDLGCINGDARWPNNCIDWERAADELKQDYSSVTFDGNDYWYRS